MANRLLHYIAALLLILSASFGVCMSQCTREFLVEPGVSPDSPLDCNVIGASVTIGCEVELENFFLGWYYTSNVADVGDRDGVIDTASLPRYREAIVNGASSYINNLVISSYNRSDNGFYWCEVTTAPGDAMGSRNPSQAVLIESRYTVNELETCDSDIVLQSEGERCAFLDSGGNPTTPPIVVGVTFIDIATQPPPTAVETTLPPLTTEPPPETTLPPPPETTFPPPEITLPPPTTPPPTLPPITTTPPPPTTPQPDNVIRNALIGSSVAVVVIMLVACGVILCLVAICRY